jgi:signal transduction histidine kinase
MEAVGPVSRSTRDWFVDTAMFVLALAFWLFIAATSLKAPPPPDFLWLDRAKEIVGVLACGAIWYRRRWPLTIAVTLVLLSVVSDFATGAMLVALFVVAVHQPVRTTLMVFALSLVAHVAQVVVDPDLALSVPASLAISACAQSMVVGWGLFVHRHRELVSQIRSESELKAERARHLTQEAIAREMHDVLGHRLSLLSVHAGALEYRPDMSAEDVASTAKVIRESAHQALQDLREVIGVLRAPVGELPQPTFVDIRQLVDESADAGMQLTYTETIEGSTPDRLGRTAYRIVQEALTNARKHAPGGKVEVRMSGSPEDGLTVDVDNGPATRTPVPGDGGEGLVGLAERVSLAGGKLRHGPAQRGGWRLSAWLPWPS